MPVEAGRRFGHPAVDPDAPRQASAHLRALPR
jgi:hypothetical protein